MPRILVADDHSIVRRHVREVLESEEGWEVCAEAATGREAVEMTASERPDVVVLDLCMPELNGLQAARQIHEQFPETGMLLLTMHDPLELIDQVIAYGVRTCVLKTDLHHLVAAVRGVWQQSRDVSNPPSNRAPEKPVGPHADRSLDVPAEMLTDLERQIVQMLAQAKNSQDIAIALSLTVKAVEVHRAAIMCKLKINSIFELVHYAVRKKLVETKSTPNPFVSALP
jgi:DNA-binding NarL/FixJ family response regulator